MKKGWVKKKLGEVATYINGYAFKPAQWEDNGIPIIRIQNLNNPNATYNYFNGDLPEKYLVKKGDILISWSASLGAYEWKSEDAYLNQHIFKVDFNKCDIDKYFLKYAVESRLPAMLKDVHGATMQHIVKKDFDNTQIPFPPLPEQQQIVSELDCLQGIIDKKKEQLQELDKLAQSIFYTMFGDPVENEKGWKVEKLKHLCPKITDGTHNSPTSYPKGEFMYITAKNIKADGICLKDITYVDEEVHEKIYARCNPVKGDILYIKDGATTGIATINTLNERFSLLSSVALLKCNIEIINNYFLKETLNFPSKYKEIRNNMGGAAITRLTIRKIQDISIPLPPLSLQQEFADKITAIEQQKARIQQSLQDTETLFNSRMDYYFG